MSDTQGDVKIVKKGDGMSHMTYQRRVATFDQFRKAPDQFTTGKTAPGDSKIKSEKGDKDYKWLIKENNEVSLNIDELQNMSGEEILNKALEKAKEEGQDESSLKTLESGAKANLEQFKQLVIGFAKDSKESNDVPVESQQLQSVQESKLTKLVGSAISKFGIAMMVVSLLGGNAGMGIMGAETMGMPDSLGKDILVKAKEYLPQGTEANLLTAAAAVIAAAVLGWYTVKAGSAIYDMN